ncbi:MAG: peptide deformylase [Minisyncoccia bacterium]
MKEIVQDGAKVLRDVAQPVPEELFGSAKLAKIIEDMKESLDPELEGVALAAPQIGVPYRIFIVRKDRTVPPPPPNEDLSERDLRISESAPSAVKRNALRNAKVEQVDIYINPEIIKTSRKRAPMDEGCLSVRGVYGTAKRHERVTVRAQNIDGSSFKRGASKLMAQIFEHEIDHLNGVLFIDHAERLIEVKHTHDA